MRKQQVDKERENFDKILAWKLRKVRNKREGSNAASKEGRTVRFGSLMDICHLKNSELDPQFQKYNNAECSYAASQDDGLMPTK